MSHYTGVAPCHTDQNVNEYVRRKENLLELGYPTYRAYLRSSLWTDIRTRKLKQDPKCFGCNRRAQQVHHEVYSLEVLTGETLRGLYSICKRCHYKIEFTPKGDKRDPKQATDILKRLHRMAQHRKRWKADNRVKTLMKLRTGA